MPAKIVIFDAKKFKILIKSMERTGYIPKKDT